MSNSNTWPQLIETLTNGLDLSATSAQWAMNEILQGETEISQIKEFLLALKSKGETAEEVNAFVGAMYQHSASIEITERAVDTVGTGGDGFNTINISTTAAIVAAAAGAKVLDGLGADGHGAHAPSEYIKISTIEPRIKLTNAFLIELLK